MYKIAVMGDMESVQGFATLGLDTYAVESDEQAIEVFKKLTGDNYGVIYLTEALQEKLEKYIDNYANVYLPAIIPIPGITGNTGKGILNVKKSVERAVGSDIIFGND
ncbi:hypothetical protein HMPREF9630_01034 [Peptoanaerobacter stomatis]|jgi:ATP synthase, subunit F|uniref:ATP synthase, subunit F n=1 Tax=Peptoanaerobacter stomatis TaxID=796937 RepID=J6HHK7_9FIRM|nr:V-type ATP synthase subunit F [Peptoanaerobacter stomatis]EHL14585.1 hypothetical protein HMPREF9630_01034 [Peptoanaerobacter stomatis]EJU22138.1 ATP synthase, subunit F [Peptoanaerobacter stomatis]NWO24915.1 V-type ATP synthase subunit F [Peptostreptococcaceae bacterium oral taxon 081]